MRWWMCGTIVLVFCGPVSAHVVKLKTGDIIKGPVVEQTDTAVRMDHPVLGPLTIPADQVLSVQPDAPEADPEQSIPSVETQISEVEASESRLDTPPSAALATTADGAIEADPKPASGILRFLSESNAQLELGLNGSEGNTDEMDLRAAFKAGKTDDRTRWKLDTAYNLSKTNNERTTNDATVGLVNDWLLPDSKWFYFAQGRFDYDEFQDWERRVSGSGGLGYQFIKNDTWDVLGRFGGGVTKNFGDVDDDLNPEGQIGGEMTWRISKLQTLGARTTVFPNLDDHGESRIISAAEWTMQLDRFEGLSFKLGLENEYESETSDDSDHNDLTYYGALVISF